MGVKKVQVPAPHLNYSHLTEAASSKETDWMSVSIKLLQLVFGNREQKMFVLQYLPRLCPETLNRVKKSEVAMMVLRAEPHDAITMAGVVMVSTLVTGSTLPPSGGLLSPSAISLLITLLLQLLITSYNCTALVITDKISNWTPLEISLTFQSREYGQGLIAGDKFYYLISNSGSYLKCTTINGKAALILSLTFYSTFLHRIYFLTQQGKKIQYYVRVPFLYIDCNDVVGISYKWKHRDVTSQTLLTLYPIN